MDGFIAYVRTFVPIAIGAVVTFLARQFDIVIDSESAQGAVLFVNAVVTGAYYALIKYAETRFPWIGWLIGYAKSPTYL